MTSSKLNSALFANLASAANGIVEAFEAQAATVPSRPAVIFGDQQLTYGELNSCANQLAWKLKALGTTTDGLVGICLNRSLEIVIGLLGILKSGAAYVPIDPAYPAERVAYMMVDSAVSILLTQESLVDNLPAHGAKILCLDSEWQTEIASSAQNDLALALPKAALAYVIYTSGSTGQPKGAMNTHAGISNRLRWMQRAYRLTPEDRVLQKTPFSFDVSVWEFFWPLMTGAQLVVAKPGGHQDSRYLVKTIQEQSITTIHFVPSMLRVFLEEPGVEDCRSLRRVICSGEALPIDLKEKFFSRLDCELHNLYGPTEAAVDVTSWRCRKDDESSVIPIGHPIDNIDIYVLDSDMTQASDGSAGEIYIGGIGVGRGYLRRPELTAERFVPNPFGTLGGERLYWTGDLGRQLKDGAIEYLGRTDFQVKLRGFRIELGEIEAALLRHSTVKDAVVVARGDASGDQSLVAYVVLENSASDPVESDANRSMALPISKIEKLQNHLRESLPSYMVPSSFVLLEKLPLGPNGKIDRKGLPVPECSRERADGIEVQPRTATEEKIVEIWRTVLHLTRFGIHDNFFELGGHSLLATQFLARLRSQLNIDLPLPTLFANPTIAAFGAAVDAMNHGSAEVDVPRPRTRHEDLPLSFSQERVWFMDRLKPGNLAYNYQSILRIEGKLSVNALEKALQNTISRHEICRTTFHNANGRPIQVIHEPYSFSLPVIHVEEAANPEATAQSLIQHETQRPFDLEKLPLIYWILFKLGADRYVLFHKEHHMLHDGWSFNVFLNELFDSYKAYAKGIEPVLPGLPIQFADFALWQREWAEGKEVASQLEFWKQRLEGAPELLMLPWDRSRPRVASFKGAAPRLEIPLDICELLRRASRKHGVTLFMMMFTAFLILLRRLSGATDISVGSGIANRRWKETECLLGMIVNNVVLRADLSGNPSIEALLHHVRDVALQAYANQDVPFDRVVQTVLPGRTLAYNPLFQVMFSFHDSPIEDLTLPGATVALIETLANQSAKWDINIIVIPRAEQKLGASKNEKTQGITVVWEYSSDLFDAATMQRWMGMYLQVLTQVAGDYPQQHIDELPLIDPEQALLLSLSPITGEADIQENIVKLFEESAELSPNVAALTCGERTLTYRELSQRSNRLAHRLRKKGAGPEIPIGICMDRSIEMVIGLLAILKSGSHYVPIDPEYPAARKQWIAQETKMPAMLVQPDRHERIDNVEFVSIGLPEIEEECSENPKIPIRSDNLAYIIYTSGSTGAPKGVAATHGGVARLVKNPNYVSLTPDEKLLQFAPLSFDASAFEIWGALLNGAELVLMPAGKTSLQQLGAAIRQHGITTLWLSAGLFRLMVDHHLSDLGCVRQLLAGGDVVSVAHANRLLQEHPNTTLINGYGPTENATFTCCHALRPGDELGSSVPIGKPITGTHAYVLDDSLQMVPAGVVGELYAGGEGLARGYVNRPELTAERFVPNPFAQSPGERLYRIGDLVRYRGDGVIEFLGRKDQQVKIRGFRIELGEIETALGRHKKVKQNVVLAEEDVASEKRLTAYVVADKGVSTGELKEHLRRSLPEYMLPASIVLINDIPLTVNGKIDHKELLRLARASGVTKESMAGTVEPPRNEMEQMVAAVWRDLLKSDYVGIHDSFFERGGHSLLVMRMLSVLKTLFGVDIDLRKVFDAPTIANVAILIADALRAGQSDIRPIVRHGRSEYAVSFAQRGLWFIKQTLLENPVYNMPLAHRLQGPLDVPILKKCFQAIVDRHEILRTSFSEADGDAAQIIHSTSTAQLEREDLSALPAKDRERTLQTRLSEEARQPFDLSRLPLLRVCLFKLAPQEHVLLLVFHHIIADGWSLGVLYKELGTLYYALCAENDFHLDPLPVQYGDYALWQRESVAAGDLDNAVQFWTTTLAGAPDTLELGSRARQRGELTRRGTTERFEFDPLTTEALRQFNVLYGVTLHMTLLSVYALLLHRISGQDSIIVGVPVANRGHEQTRNMVGLFTNMLPIRIELSGDLTFAELLARVKSQTLAAYIHQDLPFERLVEHLKPERTLDRHPVFQVVLNMLPEQDSGLPLEGIDSTSIDVDISSAKFDLYLEFHEYQGKLRGRLILRSDCFSEGTGKDLGERFTQLVAQVLAGADRRVSDFDLLLQADKGILQDAVPIDDLAGSFLL